MIFLFAVVVRPMKGKMENFMMALEELMVLGNTTYVLFIAVDYDSYAAYEEYVRMTTMGVIMFMLLINVLEMLYAYFMMCKNCRKKKVNPET